MKGTIVKQRGAPATVVDDLEVPVPADDQILVKSIYMAINPVDSYLAYDGGLVLEWPLVLGVDAGGVVAKVGSKAVGPVGPFKVGDEVLGCTRLGNRPYSTAQEYFLMDARLATLKPSNITTAQACTVGAGSYTSSILVFPGLGIPFPEDPKNLPPPTGEWVLVFGGAGGVGKFTVQVLHALGYKVIATGSKSSAELLKSIGAAETIDYRKSTEEIVSLLTSITGGNLRRIVDAVGKNKDVAQAFYKTIPGEKYFTTVSPNPAGMGPEHWNGANVYPIALGPIGRADAVELNNNLTKFIPFLYHLLETGATKPAEYDLIGETGFESVIEAWEYQQSGKGGNKKVIVKVQDA